MKNFFKSKKVLITGHTGFKGGWLSIWLLKMGAKVIGVSKDVPTNPSMFEILKLRDKIVHYEEDVRNLEKIKNIINNEKPDFIFHLAAQAIVSTSFKNPSETVSTNVLGTTNILDVLKDYNKKCIAIFITSDKCYDNVEWIWGYRESDKLGGKDVYSGSKAAAENIIKSYFCSFFNKKNNNVKIGIEGLVM